MRWDKLSAAELREILAAFGLPTNGAKAALVERYCCRFTIL